MAAQKRSKPSKPSIRSRIKKQKTELIQEEILAVAANLIAERGFRAVTVDQISAEMGFSKSIVYYYMKNKNEILWRIFEKIDETYSRNIEEVLSAGGPPVDRLGGVIRTHCMNVLTHRAWSTIYNRDENELNDEQQRVVSQNKRKYNKLIEDLYAEGVEQGIFRDFPPVIAVSCLIGACNWAYTWFRPSGKLSAEEIATAYADQLISGVAA